MGVFSSFLSVVQENAAISAWLLRPAGGGGGAGACFAGSPLPQAQPQSPGSLGSAGLGPGSPPSGNSSSDTSISPTNTPPEWGSGGHSVICFSERLLF